MNRETEHQWCVVLCNTDFTVKRIVHSHNLDLPIKENDVLVTLVDPNSLDMYFNFVLEMQQRKFVFLKELNIVDAQGQSHLLDISCIRYENHFLFIGASKEMAFKNELLAINQDLTKTLRPSMQENTSSTVYMDQLSGLNNELINAKRELVKKNVEVTQLLEKKDALTEQLEELVRTKDLLFSIIAHDLRSPLGSVMNLMNMVTLDEDSYQEAIDQHLFTYVKDSAANALRLLEDLLQWYKYSQSDSNIKKQICNLHELINAVVQLYKGEAARKGIQLTADVEVSIPVFVDPYMVSTVLRNLLSNALKFTPKGKSIIIKAREDGHYCRVMVADTGIGIAPEQLKGLFDLQKNKSTIGLSGEKGNGFGLILVRDLVEKNGGTIYADSIKEQGTTFTFTLPVDETTL